MNKYDFSPKSELKAIHELPDPFLKPDGTRVQTREEWPEQREYLKAMLTHYLYGTMPPPPGNTRGKVTFSRKVYNGRAIAETVHITCGPKERYRLLLGTSSRAVMAAPMKKMLC